MRKTMLLTCKVARRGNAMGANGAGPVWFSNLEGSIFLAVDDFCVMKYLQGIGLTLALSRPLTCSESWQH